ncbi:MAG TPA: hypothetical protein VFV86_05735 [Nitrososphaeraceae archaeon]|nr:hypothetical protein [Nitrososphaeraceae archaeon]
MKIAGLSEIVGHSSYTRERKRLGNKANKLTSIGIKKVINRAIWTQGLRKKLKEAKKRHAYATIHSYRKWFKAKCEVGGIKPINKAKLLSHSIGISNSYYGPREKEIFCMIT